MKTIKKLILLGIITLISASCSKSEEPEPDNTSSGISKVSGSMKATIDGKAWEAKTVSFGGLSALIDVTGKIDDANIFSFQFVDTKLELNKVYQFDLKNAEPNINGNLLVKVSDKTVFAKSGTFKITQYKRNQVIEGEMNAELSNYIDTDIKLENCKFKMEYK
jgi:hypothetical protein